MSYKKLTHGSLVSFIILAILYFMGANQLPVTDQGVGPQYFPKLLAVLLVVLCLINFWTVKKKVDKKVEVPNMKLILITILLLVGFIILWKLFGYFYIFAFLYMVLSLIFYTQKKRTISTLLKIAGISLTTLGAIYLLFNVVLNFNI